jgi:hypothetical protein
MGRSRLHSLDEQVLDKMRALQREGVHDYARLHRAIRDDLRANCNLTNVVGGYWVLGIEPEATITWRPKPYRLNVRRPHS